MGLVNNIALWMLNSRSVKRSEQFFANWNRVHSVLILAREEQLQELAGFVAKAEQAGKAVCTVFIYKGKPGQAPPVTSKAIAVSRKELGAFGLPKEETVSAMNTHRADVLINLGSAEDVSLLALSKLAHAPCRIAGFENAVFDISISAGRPIGTTEFLEQVYTYLNMIRN